jgi:hypothetical protein
MRGRLSRGLTILVLAGTVTSALPSSVAAKPAEQGMVEYGLVIAAIATYCHNHFRTEGFETPGDCEQALLSEVVPPTSP